MQRLGRILGNVFAIALTVLSLSAIAESQLSGRDFNHISTGFPLSGGHATAACETCHIGGVFKGIPRNCDGCHALGKAIVATPKSSAHIVTDAPCETCHFNTATFYGARYNHANAQPGKCEICHNGRLSITKPSSHNTGKKLTEACDSCHRSSTWLPASWNHNGVGPGTCTTCHIPGGQSDVSKPASHVAPLIKGINQCDDCHYFTGWSPARYKHIGVTTCATCHTTTAVDVANRKPASHVAPKIKGVNPCEDCHITSAWLPARYIHNTVAACSSCHDSTGSKARGYPTSHSSFPSWPTECNQCHLSTTTFLGALGAMPSNHIPFNAGANCSNCHTGTAKVNVTVLHANSVASRTCATCHITPNSYTGNNQETRKSHDGSSGNNCTGCHEHSNSGSYGGW